MNEEKTRFTTNPFGTKPISTLKIVKKIRKDKLINALANNLSIEFDFSKSTTVLLTEILIEVFNEPKNLMFLSYKKTTLSRPTFYKAVEALESKKMIFPAEAPGMYWLNPVLTFNKKFTVIKEYIVSENEDDIKEEYKVSVIDV
jgi:hypothetical protein